MKKINSFLIVFLFSNRMYFITVSHLFLFSYFPFLHKGIAQCLVCDTKISRVEKRFKEYMEHVSIERLFFIFCSSTHLVERIFLKYQFSDSEIDRYINLNQFNLIHKCEVEFTKKFVI